MFIGVLWTSAKSYKTSFPDRTKTDELARGVTIFAGPQNIHNKTISRTGKYGVFYVSIKK